MEQNLFLELLESGEKVSLYSPRFEGEEYTEFEKFLLTYKEKYLNDIQILIRRIDNHQGKRSRRQILQI